MNRTFLVDSDLQGTDSLMIPADDDGLALASAWPQIPLETRKDGSFSPGMAGDYRLAGTKISNHTPARFTVDPKKKEASLSSSESAATVQPSDSKSSSSSKTTSSGSSGVSSSGTNTTSSQTSANSPGTAKEKPTGKDSSNVSTGFGSTDPPTPKPAASPFDTPASLKAKERHEKNEESSSSSGNASAGSPPVGPAVQTPMTSGSGVPPVIPPPPAATGFADGDDNDSFAANFDGPRSNFLPGSEFDGIPGSEGPGTGFFEKIGNSLRDFFSGLFRPGDSAPPPGASMLPVTIPPVEHEPGDVERDDGSEEGNHFSQGDLEDALGRQPDSLCCAASLLYPIQVKYPDLDAADVFAAAKEAANGSLADGSGPRISENGYVGSIYQFNQAVAKSLGLDEYVDVSGLYSSVEAAEAAGETMMKVQLSGTIDEKAAEHHVFRSDGKIQDPLGDNGFHTAVEKGSLAVDRVMGLNWFPLP